MVSTRSRDRLLPALAGASLGLGLAARASVIVPLADNLSSPELVAARPSSVSVLFAAAAGAVFGILLGAWLARRGAARALNPLLLPGLAGLALAPGATALAPPLAALSGPVLDLLLLGSAGATLWRVAEHFGRGPSVSARQAGILAFLLYVALGWHLQGEVGLSGDEPHYLLISQSLLRDGDLEIENNYARGDWREYYRGKIRPHLAEPGRAGAARYSIHGVGLPILLIPGFAFLGLTGVLLTEALFGALLVHQVYRAAELLGASRGGALFAACGLGATAPALFLSTSAYPELPAALATAVVFRRLLSSESPRGLAALGYGLGLSALAFLHAKFLPLAAVLALALSLRFTAARWRIAAGFFAGIAAVAIFFFVLFGDPNPTAAYGRPRLFLGGLPLGLAGLFFDQEAGLLPASPFYFFAIAALARLCAVAPRAGFTAAAVLLAVALPGAAHPLWSGGSSPPARFLFPALPLLAVAAGAAFAGEGGRRDGLSRWAPSLLLASLLLGATMALGPGQPLYLNQRNGSGRIWEALGRSWDLTHYLPSLVTGGPRERALAATGAVLLLGSMGIGAFRFPIRPPPLVPAALAVATLMDWTLPGRAPEGSAARWHADLLRRLPDRESAQFYALRTGAPLTRPDLLGRLKLPLESPSRLETEEEAEPGFASAPLFIPAGAYRLEGQISPDALLCNGEGCFAPAESGRAFDTPVGLRWFQVRAARAGPVQLEPLAVTPTRLVAQRSERLGLGVSLHFLDENTFSEPGGFWLRGRSSAAMILEAEAGAGLAFTFRNGGEDNRVEFEHPGGRSRFALRPWEEKRVEVAVRPGLARLVIGCTAVFRAMPRDGAGVDRRPLGVFVAASRL